MGDDLERALLALTAQVQTLAEKVDAITSQPPPPPPSPSPASSPPPPPPSPSPASSPPPRVFKTTGTDAEWIPAFDKGPVSDAPPDGGVLRYGHERTQAHRLTGTQIQMLMEREWLGPRRRFDKGLLGAVEDGR